MLKAVLFDMDDTLLDWSCRSEDWPTYERQHLAQVYDYIVSKTTTDLPFEAYYQAATHLNREAWMNAGDGLRAPDYRKILHAAMTTIGIENGQFDEDNLLRAYAPQLIDGVRPFPDVPEILPILSSHVHVGLITNAGIPMWARDRELADCGLLVHFTDCRLSAADVGYLKPHPAVFRAALDKLGIEPHEAVFVGDSPEADIAGAQGVGMKAVLRVIGGQHLISGLIVPDAAINTLHELLPILDGWYPDWRNGSNKWQ